MQRNRLEYAAAAIVVAINRFPTRLTDNEKVKMTVAIVNHNFHLLVEK
jgi:hypothetical protein